MNGGSWYTIVQTSTVDTKAKVTITFGEESFLVFTCMVKYGSAGITIISCNLPRDILLSLRLIKREELWQIDIRSSVAWEPNISISQGSTFWSLASGDIAITSGVPIVQIENISVENNTSDNSFGTGHTHPNKNILDNFTEIDDRLFYSQKKVLLEGDTDGGDSINQSHDHAGYTIRPYTFVIPSNNPRENDLRAGETGLYLGNGEWSNAPTSGNISTREDILSALQTASNTLADLNISNAYTKVEVDGLISSCVGSIDLQQYLTKQEASITYALLNGSYENDFKAKVLRSKSFVLPTSVSGLVSGEVGLYLGNGEWGEDIGSYLASREDILNALQTGSNTISDLNLINVYSKIEVDNLISSGMSHIDLSMYLSKQEASTIYLTKADASTTYAKLAGDYNQDFRARALRSKALILPSTTPSGYLENGEMGIFVSSGEWAQSPSGSGGVSSKEEILEVLTDTDNTISTFRITDVYTKGSVDYYLSTKVDKVAGKGLSTNDFTTELKNKLDGLSNYSLPTASSSVLGGVKIGANINISNGVISIADYHPKGGSNTLDFIAKKLNVSTFVLPTSASGLSTNEVGLYLGSGQWSSSPSGGGGGDVTKEAIKSALSLEATSLADLNITNAVNSAISSSISGKANVSDVTNLSNIVSTKQDAITTTNKLPYSLISGTPTISNSKITITQNGVEKGSFTLNQSSAKTIEVKDTTYGCASSTTLGLVKIGSNISVTTDGTISIANYHPLNGSSTLDFAAKVLTATKVKGATLVLPTTTPSLASGEIGIYAGSGSWATAPSGGLASVTKASIVSALSEEATSFDDLNLTSALSSALSNYQPKGNYVTTTALSNELANYQLKITSTNKLSSSLVSGLGTFATKSSLAFSEITNKPTTIAGYGISDAITTANIGSQSVSYASSTAKLKVADIRDTTPTPNDLSGYSVTAFFNNLDKPSGCISDWLGGLTIKGWHDNYIVWQIAATAENVRIRDTNLYWRQGLGTTWESWKTIIDSGNISSQSVASAGKLTTPRTIWGQSFDGSGNVDGDLTANGTIKATSIIVPKVAPSSPITNELYLYSANGEWATTPSGGTAIVDKASIVSALSTTATSLEDLNITSAVNSAISNSISGKADISWVTNQAYATQTWVTDKGYATASALSSGLATKQDKITSTNKLSYSLISGTPTIPTALKSPYSLTFGTKTYDGSSAKTITASDLGALTSISSSMVTTALGYTPYNSANFTKANIKSTLGISDWALASSKPSYSFSEIGSKPTTIAGYGISDAITTANIGSQSVSYATSSNTSNYLNAVVPTAAGHKFWYYSGHPTIGTASGNAYSGSSADYKLYSFPTGYTTVASNTANVMNIRMSWGSSHWHDIYASPNHEYVWHRNVYNGSPSSWKRFVLEDSEEVYDINVNKLNGYNRSNLYSSAIAWADAVGRTTKITIEGDSNTYYPVTIHTPSNKSIPTFISIHKNLGTRTPNISGNHSNGTSSLWLQYECRQLSWDGNGGYVKTLYYYQEYGKLCSHTTHSTVYGELVVWLRGGTCDYWITTTNACTIIVRYQSENIGTEGNPFVVAPRTDLGNLGIYTAKAYVGYGNITGNASTATKLSTPRTIWGQSFDGSGNVDGNLTANGTIKGTAINITNTGAVDHLTFARGSYNYFRAVASGGSFCFISNGKDLVRNNTDLFIGGSGVGIGTTTPTQKLDVNGTIKGTHFILPTSAPSSPTAGAYYLYIGSGNWATNP